MNGSQAVQMFQRIVDDESVGSDIIIDFLNTAQDELLVERVWVWFKSVDTTTMDWLSSDTYLTAHTPPTNMFYPIMVHVSGLDFPLEEVPLELRETYRDISYRHYWNYSTNRLHFTGNTTQNRDVYLTYIVKPTEIADDSTDIAYWPTNLQRMLVYKAAELWLAGTDADNITKLMAPEHARQYAILKKGAIMLNSRLLGKARNFQGISPSRDLSRQADVLDI